jgi:hypothetical protein
MLARCHNANSTGFKYYGGRGIEVCKRWRNSFAAFLEDMGERPSAKYSIDRIDCDGDYQLGNCRWVTASVQAANKRRKIRRLAHLGQCRSVSEWASITGLSKTAIYGRLRCGWSVSDALTKPLQHGHPREEAAA